MINASLDEAALPPGWVLVSISEDEPGERRHVVALPATDGCQRRLVSFSIVLDEGAASYVPQLEAACREVERSLARRRAGTLTPISVDEPRPVPFETVT